MRQVLVGVGLVLVCAGMVEAQTVLPPAPLKVAWDAPTDAPANLPTAYIFETFRETETGVTVTTLEFPATTAPTATIPASVLPDGIWFAALKAKNAAAVSGRSNAIGPFVVAGPPTIPQRFRVEPGS